MSELLLFERQKTLFKRKEHEVFVRFELDFCDPVSITPTIKVFTQSGDLYTVVGRLVYGLSKVMTGLERKEVLAYVQDHSREILYRTLLHTKLLPHTYVEKNVDKLINFVLDLVSEEREV